LISKYIEIIIFMLKISIYFEIDMGMENHPYQPVKFYNQINYSYMTTDDEVGLVPIKWFQNRLFIDDR